MTAFELEIFEMYEELSFLPITYPSLESYFRLKYSQLDKEFIWFLVKILVRVDFKYKEFRRKKIEHRQSNSSINRNRK